MTSAPGIENGRYRHLATAIPDAGTAGRAVNYPGMNASNAAKSGSR